MRTVVLLGVAMLVVGCKNKPPTIYPSNDPMLNRPATQQASESAKLFPYPADLEVAGNVKGRAEIGYSWNQISLLNMSGQDWNDAELWVNRTHVVRLPLVRDRALKRIPFKAMFDEFGQHFPLDNNTTIITVLELKLDGKLYNVPRQIGR